MKGSIAIGIKDALEREVPDQPLYPYREVNREIREQLIEEMKSGIQIIPEDYIESINIYIKEDIKTAKVSNNFKKSFTVVDAMIDGKKKIIMFASRSLAYKVMDYIRETYKNIDLTYEITQM